MSLFISNAMAEAASAPAHQSDGTYSLIMIAAIFGLFYFMMIRPQNKRAKEVKHMLSHLKIGDEIVINGGILGKIVRLNEQYIRAGIAEGTEINVQRHAVNAVLPKGTLKAI